MIFDFALEGSGEFYDFVFENNTVKDSEDLITLVLVAIFSDARATASDIRNILNRRGFHGTQIAQLDQEIFGQFGSKLWLFEQSRLSEPIALRLEAEVRVALNSLIIQEFCTGITVSSELSQDRSSIKLTIVLQNAKNNNGTFDTKVELFINSIPTQIRDL